MNAECRRRLDVAGAIAPIYATDRDVAAVIVGGSVARGTADRFSDLELGIFWSTAPTLERCAELASNVGATGRQTYPSEPGTTWWEENFTRDGLGVDVLHATTADTERLLADVTVRFDTTPAKLVIAGVLSTAIPLAGGLLLDRWRRLAAYPYGLAVAVVRAHLSFGPTSYLRMLAERGDVLLLYGYFGQATRLLVAILHGLNQVYPPDTNLKWMHWTIDRLTIAPDRFLGRCLGLFHTDPVTAVDALHDLILETLALIDRELPEVTTASIRDRIAQRRQVW